ncbi:hypothetical protein BX616_001487 [Lobosporangium transversale]|uniref:G-protein coupled receptors family 2 profile 2 domain-containing protein n=1 Tax=Lobosporangium transversale TaxID=64571 RepID=A0A1Y2GJ80_9FUNG|nr:hypothetical protein BCR41DRAFT_338469 [Lobosporangium transversale]KAF9917279.1 hypothetical protein BX616_001487 [Lobosporangium transversale]ORZ11292.1 hypothetical protein BCR41DRAFT_338469 [Lobosporangium transversale]|eukprot:XP_021879607.1 hypothetical protein BCR41DRAFT_338469 [Lobosporangium transversale]
MIRVFSKIATMASLALVLMKSTTEALGSSAPYTGTLCKNYVNYEVWLPPNHTVESIENEITAMGIPQASALSQINEDCYESFMEYVCSTAFPRVEPIVGQNNVFNVRFACTSTCQTAVTKCSQLFTVFHNETLIPKCDSPIPGSSVYQPPNGVAFQPDGACNVVHPLEKGSGPTNRTDLITTCDPPFIVDPMTGPGGSTANQMYCMHGCCLPCPAQYHLYREGALETGFKITNTIRAVSMVLAFLLMMTYLCLDDKRSHPSALILFFSIGVFLFSVVILFPLFDTHGMQCADAINPSTQQNNLRCAIQGAILIFASVATCAWCTALILNLHLHTVWNSAWFARKYWLLHIVCWGFAIAVTVVALVLGEVKWEYATLCLVSQDRASEIFFYPLAVMIFPAFLVHVLTFIHIARITILSGEDSETMSRSTLSAGAAAMISHRRHVIMAIRIQWRAALMAICAIVSVMLYWLFYFIQLRKINPLALQSHVLEFVFCLRTGNPHDSCADVLAPHLPPYGLMIAAESVVSSVGTVIFIVFFKPALVIEWGEKFSSLGYLLSGKGKQKKEQEQFFVI